jgi:putative ABC transport system ATP-binding protein
LSALVSARGLSKHYQLGLKSVPALEGISFEVERGTFACIMGPSGSGKSTLLHLVGGLDRPTGGKVVVDGADLGALSDEDLTSFRRRKLGFVFQFFNLLPTMTAWENVALPLLLDGRKLSDVRPGAEELLERVGLGHRLDHKPGQLSGGEMQRVAIARALAPDPVLLLADEPTGNLDSASGQAVLDLLRSTAAADGKTVIMVTHDAKAASTGEQIIQMEDGRLVSAQGVAT